jgi:hypothetical protein
MSVNRKRAIVLVFWVGVVAALVYWRWWPHPIHLGSVGPDQRVFVVRLPEEGTLAQLVEKDGVVSLAVPEPAASSGEAAAKASPATPPQAASPTEAAPHPMIVVPHCRVADKTCKVEIESTTRIAACYAALVVPENRMAALMNAPGRVWVWVETQPK